ncbi:MAG: DUF58 domain-containing protein [Planctomycetota bacterium]|nr:DUF58 domain-containing protein [Planctomycetota bacterium]
MTKQESAPQETANEPGLRHKPSYGIFPTRRFCMLFVLPFLLLFTTPLIPPARYLAFFLNFVFILLLAFDYRRASVARSLVVKRILKQRLSLGVKNKVSIRVSNLGRRALSIKIVDDAPPTFTIEGNDFEFQIGPGEERELDYEVTPHRRGDYEFRNLHVETLGPWNLARRVYQVASNDFVKVYPNLKGVEQWALLTRKRHLNEIGVHKIRKRGQGSEFDQLRLYTRGDEFRSINWKATARRHLPITSVYQTEKSQSVVVLLDAGRRMAAWVGGLSKLDYAINASLLLAYVASISDDNIALGVFNKDLRAWLAPRKGRMQYRRFMEQLYACEAEYCYTNYRASFLSLAQKMKKRSLVVIMTDVLDPDGAKELEQAVSIFRPRHLPLVVSLRDPSLKEIADRLPRSPEDLYETVVAQEVFLDRRRMAHDIQRRGVHTVDAAPGDFSIAVVNEYLRLKARREL